MIYAGLEKEDWEDLIKILQACLAKTSIENAPDAYHQYCDRLIKACDSLLDQTRLLEGSDAIN